MAQRVEERPLDASRISREASAVQLVRSIIDLQRALGSSRPSFVPTMGALHAGHTALVRSAAELGRPVVVSIFVNPTQFGADEDFARYPRRLDADVNAAAEAGADVIFAPEVETIYPPGAKPAIPALPAVATQPGLEDAHRPGHFAGVCQVVARLFDLVKPSIAVFGEKDYQQLKVIEAMVARESDDGAHASGEGRWPELRIKHHPTVREPDGLAMSSRNVYLKSDDRNRALSLWRALQAATTASSPWEAEQHMRKELEASQLRIDYAAVRDAHTLMPIHSFDRPARALIAARLASVRLIDNIAIDAR